MSDKSRPFRICAALSLLWVLGWAPVLGADWQTLRGHVPAVTRRLAATGRLAATNQLRLAIGLPLRDPAGLETWLAAVYDPASPQFRKFLTPAEFTARFGPTAADYAAVRNFARTNGLRIAGTYDNRLLLDVVGSAALVEKAFHISLRTYRHPTEARNFFAPDAEPTVAGNLPLVDVSGLENFSRPHPKVRLVEALTMRPQTAGSKGAGSGPLFNGFATYVGADFRHAYAPGTTLDGIGQMVGLVQFDGHYASDITNYEHVAGLPNVPIETVLLDSFDGSSGDGNIEVSLDIEMAISMAPGLAQVVVFEAGPDGIPNDVLNAMAARSQIKNLSCSWGWAGGPDATTENIFLQMAAQGQSFFNASGDSDAFLPGLVDNPGYEGSPSSSPNITQVGGTALSMNGGGAMFDSEVVWNRGGGIGSSGGVSSDHALPAWQQGINSFLTHGGSTTHRNIPDVAMVADNVYVFYANGVGAPVGGTSCAAPLWAGFMALVNQQAAASGKPPAGLINPAIYEIANASGYNAAFHDTTVGDTTWASSPNVFYAGSGYDLCTGLGSPTGTNLINALLKPDPLIVISNYGFTAFVSPAGAFDLKTQTFLLTNAGATPLNWSLLNPAAWLMASTSNGTLADGASQTVEVRLSNAASNLTAGIYSTSLWFSNVTSGVAHARFFTLQVSDPLVLLPTNQFSFSGAVGGPFAPASQELSLTNARAGTLNWGINHTSAWINVSPTSGSITSGTSPTVTFTLTPAATHLSAGIYPATFLVTNLLSQQVQPVTAQIRVGQSLLSNGGFETGDFTGWTLLGNTVGGGSVFNAVETDFNFPGVVHAGIYGAFLGDTQLATLSQALLTIPGQDYLISGWLHNPVSGPEQIFLVNANTNPPATHQVCYLSNPPVLAWTNLTFVVTATGTNTVLQIAAKNEPDFFGLDDIAVTPIPRPSFTLVNQTTNAFIFSWNSLAGLVYQVQYRTNLLQAGWLDLGSPIPATADTTSLTNHFGPEPQRYYRVRQLP